MRIAVAGATGRVGRHVVELLENGGHQVVPMSRAQGVDVITGEGLDAALAGVECIVDTATGPSPELGPATEFFTVAAGNLQAAGARAGVRRIVVVSIIGIDRFTGGYNAAKVAHERAMLAGTIPVRIVRAAQFHELVGQFVEWGTRGDVVYVPRMQTQLVDPRSVAEVLVEQAVAPDGGEEPARVEIAGPRAEDLVDMARLLIAKRASNLRVEGVSDPDDPDAALQESGALLPGPDAFLAGPTFERWLATTDHV
ncbi:SDR family oxidoreductase [Pseudonocardia acaciae]|uniref:SDR family oxidoreductase n=1 Tax=Pseudonocardia acaciae TaxID=551276 RepID=UPI00048C262C|nr:NAD(P)H-binding protein [Pseudonocardia acaciae]